MSTVVVGGNTLLALILVPCQPQHPQGISLRLRREADMIILAALVVMEVIMGILYQGRISSKGQKGTKHTSL